MTQPALPSPTRRLCLLGGESAGKTTLAQALAAELDTLWVAEYGRERWLDIGGTFGLDELLHVGREQVAREDLALPRARGWLVCDTSPLTTLVYALLDHGQAPEALHELARRRYDLTVLCAPDFDFVQDGARRDAGFRGEQHALTVELLVRFGLPYMLVRGDLAQRLAQLRPLLASTQTQAQSLAPSALPSR